MKLDEIPQDAGSTTYGGHSKLLYAVDAGGQYRGVQSRGWETESRATRQALEAFAQMAADARQAWHQGHVSPLKYLMHDRRLDEATLAQAAGVWQWQLRRHFQPHVYRRLRPAQLRRYAEALGVAIEPLMRWQQGGADDV